MSREVLCGPFLDFGTSYWGSELMIREQPGLMSRGFASTGQYGIGFYSAFMWGCRVEVVTRSRWGGLADTLILEFKNGLQDRPILRKATEGEQRSEVGTTVRVWLDRKVDDSSGLLSGETVISRNSWQGRELAAAPTDLQRLCAWLCPASDADIYVKSSTGPRVKVVSANDWKKLGGSELLDRIIGDTDFHEITRTEFCNRLGAAIRPIKSADGQVIARLGVRTFQETDGHKWRRNRPIGVVTAGAFRACAVQDVAGIALGRAATASRQQATTDFSAELLSAWASEQADLAANLTLSNEAKSEIANDIRGFGGDTRSLPIALCDGGWLTLGEIAGKSWPDELVVVGDSFWSIAQSKNPNAELLATVLVADPSRNASSFIFGCAHESKAEHNHWEFHCGTLQGAILEALAKSWNTSVQRILDVSEFSTDDHDVSAPIGKKGDGSQIIGDSVDIIRNPSNV